MVRRTWRERLVEISPDQPRLAWALWMLIAVGISWMHLFTSGAEIGDPELWLDESSTYGIAARSLGTVFTLPTEFHSQPPLYYLLLHFALKVNSARWFIRGSLSLFPCLLLLQFCLFFFDELNLVSRLVLCLLFLFSTLHNYLSTALRPYGLAVFFTLVSTVMLVRMVREPTRRRAIIYCGWTIAMLYTMAFDIGVLLGHGAALAIIWLVELRHGVRATVLRHRTTFLAMAACALAYLPYLLLAYHYHYTANPTQSFDRALMLAAYTGPLDEHLGFGPTWMLFFYGCMVLALLGAAFERDLTIIVWPLVLVLQMAFVWVFIVGRSTIGMQGRYLSPGWLAAIVLVAFGFQQLVVRTTLAAWIVMTLLIGYTLWPYAKGFHRHYHAPPVVGPWGKLYREMATHPGKKVIFFYIGYAGQDFEYEARNDPSVIVATMRGRLLASGGDNHLDSGYVSSLIDQTQAQTSCYYYWIQGGGGPYASVFLPAMKRLGYVEHAPMGDVHEFCRP